MLNFEFILAHFDLVEKNLSLRGLIPVGFYSLPSEKIYRSKIIQAGSARRETLNNLSRKRNPRDPKDWYILQNIKTLADEVKEFEKLQLESEGRVEAILRSLPNLLDDSVPAGVDKNVTEIIRGEAKGFDSGNDHQIFGFECGLLDTISCHSSGPDASTLKGVTASLYRALGTYFLDHYLDSGYTEYHIPQTVTTATLANSGSYQTSKIGTYRMVNNELDDLHLLPSVFTGLSGVFQWASMKAETLPRRCVALTQCCNPPFQSMGRSVGGFLNQNQFSAVGSLAFVDGDSNVEHQSLVDSLDTALQKLGLHYRILLCRAEDTDFCANRTYAFEVWIPSQGKYFELTRCSNYGGYISRRMNILVHEDLEPPHMVGTTGIALNRLLVALLEQNREKNGPVVIPEVLRPYLRGATEIPVRGNTTT